MKTLLLKNLIFTLFVFGFVEFTFSQSYDQNVLNQNIQLRSKEINRETDSLSTVLADLKRNFEKSNSVDAKKIQDFKTTEKYDSIVHLQFITDSTLTSKKQQITILEVLQDRDNLLDSLLRRTVVKFQAPEAGNEQYLLYITKIKDDISYNNLSSKGFKIKSDIPELIKESIYQEFLKTYNSEVLQYELQMNSFQTEQLFSINPDDIWSKSIMKLKKSISDKYFGSSNDTVMMLISYETYTKWRKSGGSTRASQNCDLADKKMKQGDFIAVCFYMPYKSNNANVILDAKGDLKFSSSGFAHSYSAIEIGIRIINEKKLSKIQVELSDNESVMLYDQASTASFWGNYGKEINIVKRHLDAKVGIRTLQSEMQLLNEQKKKIDLLVKKLNTSLTNLESTLSQSSRSQKSKIDEITRIIESKDKRVENAKEEEKSRLTYIVNGDSHLKNNDFEAAISSFKNAQSIRQSFDLVEKIKIAEKKYAPILAKKQEQERLAKIERDRVEREDTKRKEREMPTTILQYLINESAVSSSAEIQDFKMSTISSCFSVSIVRVSDINRYGNKYYADYSVDISFGNPCYHEYSSKRLSGWDLEIKSNFLKRNYDYFIKSEDTEKERERQIKNVDTFYQLYKNRTTLVCGCSF